MTVNTLLKDGRGSGSVACITGRGQLIVGAAKFSEASNITLGVDDVPGNLFGPQSGMNFIVTDILLYANKSVGAADATVVIYESADGPATSTQTKVVLQTEMLKNTSRDLVGLNLEITAGMWLNAVTDDDDIFVTVMGYYTKIST